MPPKRGRAKTTAFRDRRPAKAAKAGAASGKPARRAATAGGESVHSSASSSAGRLVGVGRSVDADAKRGQVAKPGEAAKRIEAATPGQAAKRVEIAKPGEVSKRVEGAGVGSGLDSEDSSEDVAGGMLTLQPPPPPRPQPPPEPSAIAARRDREAKLAAARQYIASLATELGAQSIENGVLDMLLGFCAIETVDLLEPAVRRESVGRRRQVSIVDASAVRSAVAQRQRHDSRYRPYPLSGVEGGVEHHALGMGHQRGYGAALTSRRDFLDSMNDDPWPQTGNGEPVKLDCAESERSSDVREAGES